VVSITDRAREGEEKQRRRRRKFDGSISNIERALLCVGLNTEGLYDVLMWVEKKAGRVERRGCMNELSFDWARDENVSHDTRRIDWKRKTLNVLLENK
jgi:hypothetical protein